MHKLWMWIIGAVVAYFVIKMFLPTAFTGTTPQRGVVGTGTGLYTGGA